jgi:hypothetical protein
MGSKRLSYRKEQLLLGKKGLSSPRNNLCRNLSLGLVTKAKVCKGAGQEGSMEVTPHAP